MTDLEFEQCKGALRLLLQDTPFVDESEDMFEQKAKEFRKMVEAQGAHLDDVISAFSKIEYMAPMEF